MKRWLAAVGALSVAVLLSYSISAEALPAGYAVQAGMTQMLLSMAGVETEPIVLSREDDISKALYIPNVRGNDVLIGFPDAGIRQGAPFLLTVNGEDLMVKVTDGGQLAVIEGDPNVLPADVGDFIDCLVNNIGDLARAILELDIGGIIGNAFQLVGCIFAIL